jgi:protein-L-isoaspartate(D-aspartate) O-methyltransferase
MSNNIAQKAARDNMVDGQVRPNHVLDVRVINAMRGLPREDFAPPGNFVYADADIQLGGGRYLLNPMVTARLAQLILANNPAHVLVIGAGSGYLAAVLAASGAHVVALEEEKRLDTGALVSYGMNVEAVTGKLQAGWPAGGPYDVIVIEGAVPAIPEILAAQLTSAGRVITILCENGENGGIGRAVIAERSGNGFAISRVFDCTARPLPAFKRAPVFSL